MLILAELVLFDMEMMWMKMEEWNKALESGIVQPWHQGP